MPVIVSKYKEVTPKAEVQPDAKKLDDLIGIRFSPESVLVKITRFFARIWDNLK
ncbi:MAG: hypothetical protein KJ600_04745 [Nanoarchaeota archaeon]|nr:hypothetical protein [Nanoarchaeota archaeon]MBU1103837.1 hypothetical protein [Nanoarchaeota archaeon]